MIVPPSPSRSLSAPRSCRAARLAAVGVAALLGACASESSTSSGAPAGSTDSAGAPATAQSDVESSLLDLRRRLDRDLLAGPTIAEELGYRTLWQTRVQPDAGARLLASQCTPETVFIWDTLGVITRLRPSTGDTLWQAASSSRVDQILSVLPIQTVAGAQLVAIVTDTQAFLVDASNGLFVTRQKFHRLANTPAEVYGPFIIYGTSAGQLVWHDFEVGGESRAVQLSGQIVAPPRVVDNFVIASSTGGSVGTYRAQNSRIAWGRSLSAGITARAAADQRAVWVSCRDQYLTCLSLENGRTLWRYFTQSPMDASPTLLADSLYLQLPGEGLVSFDPLPTDKFDGVVRWRSPDAVGDVIGATARGIIAWDPPTSTLTLLEEHTGSIVRSFALQGVAALEMTEPINGDIVITGADGRVQRLTPVARRPVAAAPAPATPPGRRTAPALPPAPSAPAAPAAPAVPGDGPGDDPGDDPGDEPMDDPEGEPADEP